uniref:Uncharacterized protein n=1 Tax=Romanomermis culicivorax TaxID=13658 RepID=A0A915L8Q3_ROMCU
MQAENVALQALQQVIPADLNRPIDLNQKGDDLKVDKEVTVESSIQPDKETQVTSLVDQTKSLLSGMDVGAEQMLDESNSIRISEGPTKAEIEAKLREQAENEIEREEEIFVKKLMEQKERLDEQLKQVLAGFTAQLMPLAGPTAVQASVEPPTAYHIPKLAAMPASRQITQPGVSKSTLMMQRLQRDPSIDGSIQDVYTAEEVKRLVVDRQGRVADHRGSAPMVTQPLCKKNQYMGEEE